MMNPTNTPTYNGINANTANLLSQLDPESDFSKTYQSAQQVNTPDTNTNTNTNTMTRVAPEEKDNGNWMTNLIPTIGSIGGSLLGTLVDPFTFGMGTIAGGAGGAALGKAIENAIEGKNTTGDELLGEAAGGAIGGGLGKGIGALTKGAGSIISNQAGKGLAKEAETIAAQDALGKSQALRNVYGSIPKKILEGTNEDQALKGMVDLSGRVGVDPLNPQAVLDTSRTALDALGNVRNGILYKSGNIPTAGIIDESGAKVAPSIDDMIKASLRNTHPLSGEKLGPDRTGVLGSIEPVFGARGKLVLPNNASTQFDTEARSILDDVLNNPNVNALDLQNAQSIVGQKANDVAKAAATATGKDSIELRAQADAWKDLNNHLKGMFDNPAINKEVAAMKGNLTAEDVGGNQALADELNSRITNAQSNQDLNTSLSHFLNMKGISKNAVAAENNPASVSAVRGAKQNLAIANGTANDGTTINSTTEGNVLGSVPNSKVKLLGAILNAGNTGGKLGVAKQNLGTTLERLASVGTLAGKTGLPEDAAMAASKSGTGLLPIIGGQLPVGAAMAGTQPSEQPESYLTGQLGENTMQPDQQIQESPLQQALRIGIAGMADPYMASSYAPLVQSLTGQAQQAHTANALLQSLEGGFEKAGGGQGLPMGLFKKLGGALTGNDVASYDAQRKQAVNLLSQLGIPLSAIPDITSTAPAAQGQFQNAQNIINSLYGGQ